MQLKPARFIVLIPHRDSGKLLRDYKGRLFALGINGAYSFPIAAPLALVSQPFTKEELKSLAQSLRALSAAEGRNGRISAGELRTLPWLEGLSFFGPGLDLPIPDFPQEVSYRFPSLVLCAGLIKTRDQALLPQGTGPSFFFRAAMVANLILRPLPAGETGYSFEWRIGTPVWLPAYKNKKEQSAL
jgi:hypothetical protein